VYGEHFGASAFAANTFVRFLLSAPFPLDTVQMVDNWGLNWAISLLGFITMAMIPIPFIFYRRGPNPRARSRYLSTTKDSSRQVRVQEPTTPPITMSDGD
jgi:hypothetical protein